MFTFPLDKIALLDLVSLSILLNLHPKFTELSSKEWSRTLQKTCTLKKDHVHNGCISYIAFSEPWHHSLFSISWRLEDPTSGPLLERCNNALEAQHQSKSLRFPKGSWKARARSLVICTPTRHVQPLKDVPTIKTPWGKTARTISRSPLHPITATPPQF